MLYQAENLSLKKPNVEVSCGFGEFRACTGFYEKPRITRRQLHWVVGCAHDFTINVS